MEFKSQIGQDKFVINELNNKENGYFIDIGSGHPKDINNTYILEKQFNWNGLSFDYGPPYAYSLKDVTMEIFIKTWNEFRKTKLITGDARNHDYVELFKDNKVPKIVDYLSIDLEPPTVTLEVLKLIPFESYQFRVITFEHDNYREKSTILPSRNLLKSYGYDLVKTINNQEDWYIKKL